MNKKNKKHYKQDYYPTGIQRLDKELMSEIRLFISLGHTVEQATRAYHVSESMVRFAIKKGKDFNSLQNDLEEDE